MYRQMAFTWGMLASTPIFVFQHKLLWPQQLEQGSESMQFVILKTNKREMRNGPMASLFLKIKLY